MASVYFDPAVGGDGSTVTDDSNPTTGLANGGHRARFVPALAQMIGVGNFVLTKAGEAAADAADAQAWAVQLGTPVSGGEYSAKYHAQAAASSASSASSAASAAISSFDAFDDRYLGDKASDPATDNDGNALLTGAMYWRTTSPAGLKIWDGSAWVAAALSSVSASGVGVAPSGPLTDTDVQSALSTLAEGSLVFQGRSARSSNTALVASDCGKLIDITSGTFTQTFTAAATLGPNWFCYIRNSGTGDITLDPNASELIDGRTSYIMYPGETRLVTCDGTGFYTIVLTGYYRTFTATGTWVKPPGYAMHSGFIWGGGGGGTCSAGTYSGGGGGGACTPFTFSSASLANSASVGIGAGGGGGGAGASGATGGTSYFNGLYAYGGGGSYLGNAGGGGGSLGAGASTSGTNKGGMPANTPANVASPHSDGFGGGAGTSDTTEQRGGSAAYGGGGGGLRGGHSLFGGAGGGGGVPPGTAGVGGTAWYSGGHGGNGLYGVTSGTAGAGSAPGGGGGTCSASSGSAVGGAGARGEMRIWGVL